MAENDKQTEEGEGRELKFSFRLSKEEKADLELVAKKLAMGNKTNFLMQAVQRFKDHPEQWNLLGESVIENLVTKEELKEELKQTKEDIIENLLKTQEIIYQMQSLLAHQQENSHKADLQNLQENIKTKLLNYENLSELKTYKSVEEFLTEEFPDKEKEVIEDKIYNEILLELMQDGYLEYKVRSKTLKWSKK